MTDEVVSRQVSRVRAAYFVGKDREHAYRKTSVGRLVYKHVHGVSFEESGVPFAMITSANGDEVELTEFTEKERAEWKESVE